MSKPTSLLKKKNGLRYSEYYLVQDEYDRLYNLSKLGNNFYKLYELIIDRRNILRAYRDIKTNKGSKTSGTDKKTIEDIAKLTDEQVIDLVRNKLKKL